MGLGPVLDKNATMLISRKYASSDWKDRSSKALLGVDGWVGLSLASNGIHRLSVLKVLFAQSLKTVFWSVVIVSALWATLLLPESASAQLNMLNSNGYTGLGMVPSANVLSPGQVAGAYANQLPGATNTTGYNYNVGFGVMDNLEASARLATQDLHCNMYIEGNCPPGQIRDFSTSIKYRIPKNWLPFTNKNFNVAVGEADYGGAAAYFSSKYAVATQKIDKVEFSLGAGKASQPNASLHGFFGGVQWDVNSFTRINYDQIGKDAWIHSTLYAHPFDMKSDLYLTLNNHLTHSHVTEKSWIGVGLNLPLNDIKEMPEDFSDDKLSGKSSKTKRLRLPRVKPFDLQDELIKNGFLKAKFGTRGQELLLWVDQENFQWNAMDAAGVAMGVLASTYGDKSRHFEVVVGTRGLDILSVSGDIACVKKWIETQDPCYTELNLHSMLNNALEWSDVQWSFDSTASTRPELVVSPTLINTLGTEYGTFDLDLGANINPVVRLWKGAYLDINSTVPLGIRTHQFNEYGAFYTNRITSQISRQVVHQVVDVDRINTQAMFTAGKIYQNYKGVGVETQTFDSSGKARLDLQSGSFQDSVGGIKYVHNYELASVRYSRDDRFNSTTEVLAGQFFGGDKGVILTERFWYGDTALNFYFKRITQPDSGSISFAGFQLWVPLTPRVGESFDRLNVRGINQFTYSAESKVGSTNNNITTNVGVVPKTGDTLMQLSNQDRNSDRYYALRRDRLRLAYLDLRVEDRKSWVFD